jgi:hypothetical protein
MLPDRLQEDVDRSCAVVKARCQEEGVRLVLPAHLFPPKILILFVRVWIFLALQPKRKPIDGSLLRYHSVPGALEFVDSVVYVDELNRFIQTGQGCKPFPLKQQ